MNAKIRTELPAVHPPKVSEVEMVVFEIIKDRLPTGITLTEYLRTSATFNFFPVVRQGQIVGAYFNRGNVVHAAVANSARGKWFSKRVIRWMCNLIEKYGHLVTSVMQDHAVGHEFAKRLGFVKTHEEGGIVHYRKDFIK